MPVVCLRNDPSLLVLTHSISLCRHTHSIVVVVLRARRAEGLPLDLFLQRTSSRRLHPRIDLIYFRLARVFHALWVLRVGEHEIQMMSAL